MATITKNFIVAEVFNKKTGHSRFATVPQSFRPVMDYPITQDVRSVSKHMLMQFCDEHNPRQITGDVDRWHLINWAYNWVSNGDAQDDDIIVDLRVFPKKQLKRLMSSRKDNQSFLFKLEETA